MSSRITNPTAPGGLFSPSSGDELTPNEELVVQQITGGGYFYENETPSGAIDGLNAVFTLAHTPNPASSLELKLNGAYQAPDGADYTLAGNQITYAVAPPEGSTHKASYRVSPV